MAAQRRFYAVAWRAFARMNGMVGKFPALTLLTLHDICGRVMDMTQRLSLRSGEIHYAIQLRQDFDTANGTFTGRNGGFPYMGSLPGGFKDEVANAALADDFYVVKSYNTPVAWYANGVWSMPKIKYTVTTSRHQNIVRKAVFA